MFLNDALQIIAAALMRWVGEVEGAAASKLITAVRVAAIQMDVAKGMLDAAERPGVEPNDRAKLIMLARDLVEASRKDVRAAALGVATAVPKEVDAAFDNFAQAAANATVRVAEQARMTLTTWAVVAAVFLWFYLDHQRGGRYRDAA